MMNLLFSFNGRQRRMTFWLVALSIMVVNSIVVSLTLAPLYMAALTHQPSPAGFGVAAIFGLVASVVLFWVSLANSVKRCHDRNKSGWWLLLYWLASLTLIGVLWPLIELGFMDGTPGENQFGPSPKGIAAPVTTAATA